MIPRPEKELSEQGLRGEMMQRNGYCRVMDQNDMTPQRIAEAIESEYASNKTHLKPLKTDGAIHCAARLIELSRGKLPHTSVNTRDAVLDSARSSGISF